MDTVELINSDEQTPDDEDACIELRRAAWGLGAMAGIAPELCHVPRHRPRARAHACDGRSALARGYRDIELSGHPPPDMHSQTTGRHD
jgi:hypothetical protein